MDIKKAKEEYETWKGVNKYLAKQALEILQNQPVEEKKPEEKKPKETKSKKK